MKVERRPVPEEELLTFEEAGYCAVLLPEAAVVLTAAVVDWLAAVVAGSVAF